MTVPTIDEFTSAATAFLDATVAPKDADRKFVWGEGSDNVAMFEERTRDEEDAIIAAARSFRQARFDAGFGWITGPPQYGGTGLGKPYQAAYEALESRYDVPNQGPFLIGLGMIAPTILAHATDAAKDRYLRALWRGDLIACQLFSEPAVGSDLASLQTRAERDGDEWVVIGSEGVDVRCPVLRHRRDPRPHRPRSSQAQGHHRVHRRHDRPRRGDPTAAPDDRWGQLQRGVLQRGARSRRPPLGRRQRRLGRRPDDADERAGGDRRRRHGRRRRDDHPADRDGPLLRSVPGSARPPTARRRRSPGRESPATPTSGHSPRSTSASFRVRS